LPGKAVFRHVCREMTFGRDDNNERILPVYATWPQAMLTEEAAW
jgi:hypothetical protein